MIVFDVVGIPVQQGSKRAFVQGGRAILTEDAGPKHASWRTAVADAARAAAAELTDGPLDGPLHLDVTFRFPMPASRRKAVIAAGTAPKSTAPDLDKLIRALGDGLQAGGLIRDDARLCEISSRKVEVIGWTGATVVITKVAV